LFDFRLPGVYVFLLFWLALPVANTFAFFGFCIAPLSLCQHKIIVYNALVQFGYKPGVCGFAIHFNERIDPISPKFGKH
jgi:hypothetical protein